MAFFLQYKKIFVTFGLLLGALASYFGLQHERNPDGVTGMTVMNAQMAEELAEGKDSPAPSTPSSPSAPSAKPDQGKQDSASVKTGQPLEDLPSGSRGGDPGSAGVDSEGAITPPHPDAGAGSAAAAASGNKPVEPDTRLNLNTATLSQLMDLPGIGESKAKAILVYRESHKGFKTPEELMNVKGIGQKTYESFKHLIRV